MIHIQKMCDDLKQLGYRSLPTETRKIFHDFSSQSATINLVQVVEIKTLDNLSTNLKRNHQIMKERETLDLKNECIMKFPVLYSRLKTSSNMMLANGNIPGGIKYLYAAVIDLIVDFYTTLEVRDQDLE